MSSFQWPTRIVNDQKKFLITAKCDARGELAPEEEQELWEEFIRELVDEHAFGFIASPITIDEIEEPGKGASGFRRKCRGPRRRCRDGA